VNASRTRVVAVLVIVVAFIALTAFALLARAYRPGRGGVEVPSATARLTTQIALPVLPPLPADNVAAAQVEAATITPPSDEAPAPSAPPATPAPDSPAPPPTTNGLAPCPAGLATPTEPAGLANMVGLVPLFGPFSPEAFAMMPAFGPAFPLFGPLVIAGGQQLDAHAAEMDAAVQVVHPLEQAGFDALNPLYGPYREQFLAGEAAVAGALEPGVAAFASAPGASCLPAALALAFS
jgi:hypothetical protein